NPHHHHRPAHVLDANVAFARGDGVNGVNNGHHADADLLKRPRMLDGKFSISIERDAIIRIGEANANAWSFFANVFDWHFRFYLHVMAFAVALDSQGDRLVRMVVDVTECSAGTRYFFTVSSNYRVPFL